MLPHRSSPWRHRRGRGNRCRPTARLTMTSLMDIFTVLLLFLLKNFVVEPEALTPNPHVRLPHSAADATPEPSAVIVVSERGLAVNDAWIVDSETLAATAGQPIPALESHLISLRQRTDQLRARRGSADGPEPPLTIQGDQDIVFAELESVLATVHAAGFGQVALATLRD